MNPNVDIHVETEIGQLKKLIIHSPDGGIGKIVPAKFKEWLYDDTVHLSEMRREYNQYVKLLLHFTDPEKAAYVMDYEKSTTGMQQPDCYKPDNKAYFNSKTVLDTQFLLSELLNSDSLRQRLISAVCGWEGSSSRTENKLMAMDRSEDLAKALITGIIKEGSEDTGEFIFAPLPNFIFTRDIAITVNDHLLLSNAASPARERESLLMKFIAQYALFKNQPEKLIEITEPSNYFLLSEQEQAMQKTSLEGGDVMMIAPNHLLIGCSERTTPAGINEAIHNIFADATTGIEKISVIKIPQHRAMMHIDTVFTQVRKDTWVLFGAFSEKIMQLDKRRQYSYIKRLHSDRHKETGFKIEILRFQKPLQESYVPFKNYEVSIQPHISGLESLLRDISIHDFGVDPDKVQIIYSGNNTFPYDEREQWTDACNLLALKDGVVVGYDRNERTIGTFKKMGFSVKNAAALNEELGRGLILPDEIENTLILLPSAELSRARGGSHCMSQPLLREKLP
ncbi:arginine deiminase [Arachidicoccus rhizosphaerae]|jgi:arginine deiminase|uniref:arginine deiminase n=1 Tax=Arachidicoccus rhizosphaerae TaxID=551991 RepID=A0A1H3VEZ5_9BACT|nr:arginine deiminase family protein [Arachidicoccus rhizosphaerae]SDZ73319.1 arginine deiminase [Arachidicoccus rhizosphaerae]